MKSPTIHCCDMAQCESKRKKKAQEIRNKARNQEENVEENLVHSQ